MRKIGIEEARSSLGEVVEQVRIGGEPVTITRYGKPAVVVVSAKWYGKVAAFVAAAEDAVGAAMADAAMSEPGAPVPLGDLEAGND